MSLPFLPQFGRFLPKDQSPSDLVCGFFPFKGCNVKWLYLWVAYLFGRAAEHEFGSGIAGLVFFGVLTLFALIILWRSNVGTRLRFKVSSLILTLPFLGKFAFNHGLKNFKPGSEPDGFRGLTWKIEFSIVFPNIKAVKQFRPDSRYPLLKSYVKEEDDLEIGGARLEAIEYAFWDGRFQGVLIKAKEPEDWAGLKETSFERFGRGFQLHKHLESYHWEGEKTRAILERNKDSKLATLIIASKEILREIASYTKQKAKEGARKGF